MAGVKESLTGKLGPLPVWAWAGGISAVLITYKLVAAHRAAAAAAAAASAAAGGDPTLGDSVPGTNIPTPLASGALPTAGLYPSYNPGGSPLYDTNPAATSPAEPVDNYAWINVASDRLVAQQGFQSSVVLSALRKVIEGTPVTEAEEAIFNAAVRAAGNPPAGVPAITRQATTAPTAAPPVAPQPVTPAAGPSAVWRMQPDGTMKLVYLDAAGNPVTPNNMPAYTGGGNNPFA